MNDVDQSAVETSMIQANEPTIDFTMPKISGFDGGRRSIFKEPTLYLSVLVILIATSVCLGKTPAAFWLSFTGLTCIAVIFHVIAERFLFRSANENFAFAAPFDGVFVVTFGSIIPGLGLLAYGLHSMLAEVKPNIFEEFGKLILLQIVPIFNFIVWSALRKGYLVRPRLTGLMNGLALGLSACWTMIWLRSLFLPQTAVSCKFGWMLLLCTSPFLLFAATCLCMDLWRKTDSRMARITVTFAIMGSLLSLLFVFAPMIRALFVQSLIADARKGSSSQQARAVTMLRTITTDQDLRPSKYSLSGFALADLLIANRGLESASDVDKDLYFGITGSSPFPDDESSPDEQTEASNPLVGTMIPRLAMSKSQISGTIDATTLSSSLDWTMTFRNSSLAPQEACAEVSLPNRAVVSRVTLWINGEAREGAFAPTGKAKEVYQSIVNRQKDPLLVTMNAPNRVLVQCYPIAKNGEMRIRLGFKVPLQTLDGKSCSLELPKLIASNFTQPKRMRISLSTPDTPASDMQGMTVRRNSSCYLLTGIIKAHHGVNPASSLVVQRASAAPREFAVPDCYARGQFILQRLREMTIRSPKHLFVVIDPSASLRKDCAQIKEAISRIPARLNPSVYFEPEREQENESNEQPEPVAKTVDQAQMSINANAFIGGQDNGQVLREALENAGEQPGGAVLWIHGPQPIARRASEASALDLVHPVSLYDLQIEAGTNSTLPAIEKEDTESMISLQTVPHNSIVTDVESLLSSWDQGVHRLFVQRTLCAKQPSVPLVANAAISAQVTCLWANDTVTRLLSQDQQTTALDIAETYRLVTPVTGAIVLDDVRDYKNYRLDPGDYVDSNSNGRGLVGAPTDARFGQTNEVGMCADFGYDTMRDISRTVTALSTILSIIVATCFLRGRKSITPSIVTKAVALVLLMPTIVHLMGTFMINNFGGIGGGL